MTQIACPTCGKLAVVTAKVQGRKVKCTCGAVHRMPGEKVEPTEAAHMVPRPLAHTTLAKVSTAKASTSTVSRLDVMCPQCFATYQIAENLIGKTVKGPCGHSFIAESLVCETQEPQAIDVPQTHGGDGLFTPLTNYKANNFSAANPYGVAKELPAYLRPGGLTAGANSKPKIEYKVVKNASTTQASGNTSLINTIVGLIMIAGGVGAFAFLAYALYGLHTGSVERVKGRAIVGLLVIGVGLIGGGARVMMGIESVDDE